MHYIDVISGAIASGVCVSCIGICLLGLIMSAVTSSRKRRQGRRMERWSDDAARLEALLQAGASRAVAEQIVQGNMINAIKECRLETGLGLKEAKDVVDHYEDTLYRYEPRHTRQAH